jgi:hypothetical protein
MITLQITIKPRAGDTWPVTVDQPAGTCGTLRLDPDTLWPAIPGGVTPGRRLGEALFRGEVRDAYERALAEAREKSKVLRVLLVVEAEELQLLPWEELKAPRDGEWGGLYVERSGATFVVHHPEDIELRRLAERRRKRWLYAAGILAVVISILLIAITVIR